MLKKLGKYLKGLGFLAFLSALGMIVESICELALPSLANNIYETVNVATTPEDAKAYVLKMGFGMLGLACIGLCGGIGTMKASAIVSQRFAYRLRNDVYKKISNFSFRNIDKFSTASLTTRLTNDITMLQNVVMMSLRILVRGPALLVVAAVMAVRINPKMSATLLIMLPIIIVIVALIMKFGFPMFQKMQKKVDNVNRVVQENLIGMRVVKAFVREEHEKDKFHNSSDELAKQGAMASGLIVTVMPVMMLLFNAVIVFTYYKGALSANEGVMQIGQISVFASYVVQILMNLVMISMMLLQLARGKACGERVVEVLDTEIDIVNPEKPFVPTEPKGEVEFRNVNFKYDPESKGDNILENVSFKAKAGQIIGIVGGTGCGKSSLVNLIPRFYDAAKGTIRIQGNDINDYDAVQLRDKIGVVMQKAVLFAGTIADNLRWGKNDATEEEMWKALDIAQATEVVKGKEGGLDYMIEQGGKNLSGGQKQRLTIARAVVKDPDILILDDSASALDFATDASLRAALKGMHGDKTIFIVSQRTSSIQFADNIIVLDDGQRVGFGPHDKLLETCETYKEIYDSQFKKESDMTKQKEV